MSIALKPKTEPNGNIRPIFNLNNFYHANEYASKSDLLSYANFKFVMACEYEIFGKFP